MIAYPNCKINLGLHIIRRRIDGYHNLETVFLPVPLHDTLELVADKDFSFLLKGAPLDCDTENNLCTKAYRLLKADFPMMGNVRMTLKKNIPTGAGLGGGSSDAAFTLKMLNQLFSLGLEKPQLENYAARLGADCAFFVGNQAAYGTGIGDKLETIDMSALEGWGIVIAKPDDAVSTAEAYRGVSPRNLWEHNPHVDLRQVLSRPVAEWRDKVVNDFENSIFPLHPAIAKCKEELYKTGAVYASMTGSGAAVFGLFSPEEDFFAHVRNSSYLCKINTLIFKNLHHGRL
ncbi:MAG: 4-(cytidine 5'-diphospho)-2-C-methyl-D-erythritol kinase [Bacteroidales bacterium]|nr:4-(cytidine 5'-diphospho)-2-C-methyl-D-erythritol kinase [Bacteroidales bacterium]